MAQEIFTCQLYEIKVATIPLTEESVTKIINTLSLRGNKDPEVAHSIEDKLYIKFIDAVADDLLSKDEAIAIAKKLKELRNCNYPRWYA